MYLYHSEEVCGNTQCLRLSIGRRRRVDREVAALIRTKGPTDVVVNLIGTRRPDLVEVYLPYLASDDPVLLRGAIIGVSRLISDPQQGLVPNLRAEAEDRLIGSAEHIIRKGDKGMLVEFAMALGSVHEDRAREVLWMMAGGIAAEQARIAITWHKDPRDLPRLGAMLTGSLKLHRPQQGVGFDSLCYS